MFFSVLRPLSSFCLQTWHHVRTAPKPEIPHVALLYFLIICGLSFEYCTVLDSFPLVHFIFDRLFTSPPSSSLTAIHLLNFSVLSENLCLLYKVSLIFSLLLVYIETILCNKQWESEPKAHPKSGSWQPASMMQDISSPHGVLLIVTTPFLS